MTLNCCKKDSMNLMNLSLQEKYFNAVVLGLKTVEGRLNSPKFQDLCIGMLMSFTSVASDEVVVCEITGIHRYANFKEMLLEQGVENMLPGITCIEQGIAVYESFPGYKEKSVQIGVVAIKIQPLAVEAD